MNTQNSHSNFARGKTALSAFMTKAGRSAITSFLFIFVLLNLLLEHPKVQTYLARSASDYLTKLTGFPVSVKKVDIKMVHLVMVMDSVNIYDNQKHQMINIARLQAYFNLASLLKGRKINIKNLVLQRPSVNLIQHRDTLNINRWISILNTFSTKNTPTPDSLTDPLHFKVDAAEIRDGYFTFRENKPIISDSVLFYPKDIVIQNIYARITDLRVVKDTIELYVHGLNAKEKHSQLHICQLNTFFHFSKKTMLFGRLYAEVGESILRDSIALHFERGLKDFNKFNEKVYMNAHLDSSIIVLRDVAPFIPILYQYPDVLRLSGNFKGTLADCNVEDLQLSFGKKSHLAGKASFIGLPKVIETFMDLKLKESVVSALDIAKYIPAQHQKVMEKFTAVDFDARFSGFPTDFTVKGDFQTGLGSLKTDLSLNTNHNRYAGDIATKNFKLGQLIDTNPAIGQIDMKGYIEGKGLALDRADFILDASIDKLEILGYPYRNISTRTHLRKKLFRGKLTAKDKNLMIGIDGEVNFEDTTFRFTAHLDTVNFLPLGFTTSELTLSTKLVADFSGLTPERIDGGVSLHKFALKHEKNTLKIDSHFCNTKHYPVQDVRKFAIYSDIFDFSASGNFNFKSVADHVNRLYKEYTYSLPYKDSVAAEYYATLQDTFNTDKLSISFSMYNSRPLSAWLGRDIIISSGTSVKGNIVLGNFSDISFEVQSDTITIGEAFSCYDNNILLSLSKQADTSYFYHEAYFNSKEQKIGGRRTKDFTGLFYRENSNFVLDTYIHHADSADYLNLKAYMTILSDCYELDISNSRFVFGKNFWKDRTKGQVIIYPDGNIFIEDINFSSNEKSIGISGSLSADSVKSLNAYLKNIDLSAFNAYLGNHRLNGRVNADLSVEEINDNLHITNNIEINDIAYQDFPLGDLKAEAVWNSTDGNLDLNAKLIREQATLISLKGLLNTNSDTSKINLNALLETAPLDIATPFLKGYISHIKGVALGYLDISGTWKKPKMYGDIFIDDGQMRIDYFNTTYYLNDKIRFREGDILIRKFRLKDENENYAYLTGKIDLGRRQGAYVDIEGSAENFLAINTSSRDNSLYYGKAIVTGDFTMNGTFDNMTMHIEARGEKDTKLYIPLEQTEQAKVKDFITFLKPELKDSTQKVLLKDEASDKNAVLNVNMNLDISPDVYCEIILNKQTRDIIRGRGEGEIKMNIDTKGKFEMYGAVEIQQGDYNFTMFNIVDKKFDIVPGSRITWDGDPYQGKLNMTAAYNQSASLSPIVDTKGDSSVIQVADIKRRYPVAVLLKMKGAMLQPEISFDIDIEDYPATVVTPNATVSLESHVAAFKQNIATDERELNTQVFSLMVLKKFSPTGSFVGVSASDAISSVGELLTNQLSYWFSQVDENLEVGIDLGTIDRDALNNFRLNLSYTFFYGRLKVSRNGTFTDAQDRFLFGDITLEYLLTTEGKYRIKVYRKENPNNFETSGAGIQGVTGGASFLYTTSFDRLFKKKKK